MLWEYLGAWSSTTKLLLHLNWNANDSSWNWNNWVSTNITWVGGKIWSGSASFTKALSSRIAINWWTLPLNNFTVSCIINLTTITDWNWIIWINWTWQYMHFQVSNWNISAYFYWPALNLSSSTTLTAGVDYRIALTLTGGVAKLYINWNLDTTSTWSASNLILSSTVYVWYVFSSARYFGGIIDELIIDNRVWSASEIKRHYTYSQWKFIL